eukprot:1646354-Lingulodinium_polyedra.AAC.1
MSVCSLSNKDFDHFQKPLDDPAFRSKGTLQEKSYVAVSTPLPWGRARVQQVGPGSAQEQRLAHGHHPDHRA